MTTDPLFYRLFKTNPETFFLLLGMSTTEARVMAARYDYEAIEFKETSHRSDGVFRPREPGLPLYFLEVQFYNLPSVYADLLAKAFTYLKQHDPGQAFRGVVLFASRALEPTELVPYQALLDAKQLVRYYLDELPEVPDAPLGLSILHLIRLAESEAPAKACDLIARAKEEIADQSLRTELVQLIETVILYKLPRLSTEEVQAMLHVHDLRETRVYQEAKAEGVKEGIDKERQRNDEEKLRTIAKLAAKKMSAEDIADVVGLGLELVRQVIAKTHVSGTDPKGD